MSGSATPGGAVATLHHAPSSYYSMIARLALVETGHHFVPVTVDIHRRMDQLLPAYGRLNPGLTVPTLVLPDRVIADSRLILAYAFDGSPFARPVEEEVARHYSFPIDELTFSWLLSWNPIARRLVPRKLAATRRRLLALAAAHPDLADIYRQRAEVFAARARTFDSDGVAALFDERWHMALAQLDRLDLTLADGRPFLTSAAYGPADVVWTVFLARMRFIHRGAAIDQRPALRRYEAAMHARPGFDAADVWVRLDWLKMLRQIL